MVGKVNVVETLEPNSVDVYVITKHVLDLNTTNYADNSEEVMKNNVASRVEEIDSVILKFENGYICTLELDMFMIWIEI